MMHVTTTGAQLRISQEFLTRQTWYCNEEGKGEQVVVAAKGFHFTMGLKKVCPRNPELNLVVTCITPHASHNHLANTKKKNSYYVMLHPTCLSHKSLPENPESSKSKVKVQNHVLPYGALDFQLVGPCGLSQKHGQSCTWDFISISYIFC